MRTSRTAREDGEERGFVLIGVIMFVLALTILGLSLFNLSGFEAQFFYRSLENQQTFYDALGGIERAKFLIARSSPHKLAAVTNGFPYGDVVYARAKDMDTGDTSATIAFDGSRTIAIRVWAKGPRTSRMIEAQYTPIEAPDIYKHLITSVHPIEVKPWGADSGDPREPQTFLDGGMWQGSGAPPVSETNYPLLRPPTLIKPTPVPDVTSYFAAHEPGATILHPVTTGPMANEFTLDATGTGGIGYWETNEPGPWLGLYVQGSQAPQIHVTGTAVWLFPRGVRFEDNVTIDGTGINLLPLGPTQDRLIIVAHKGIDPSGFWPDPAIWFAAGIDASIPVILVSDARVLMDYINNAATKKTNAPYISIFANDVFVLGPKFPKTLTLQHLPSIMSPFADPILDALYGLGVLPNTDAGRGPQFVPVATTWRELDPSNPPN